MTDTGDRPHKAGVSVPGYVIERELGRGGFAVVYRAEQPKLRRTVALKILTNVDPSDDDAKRRFEAECQAIGSLSWHPHVVTVYDAGATDEGLPFLAMEHLPSGSLQAKLADHGKAPWEEVLRVAVQMCDALGAAHQAGILHRDIKPANVLTSRIGDYKLADFGIARFGDSQRTATGVITGTVAYTAPEVLRGARASSASDIYAVGAMLCAVASGRTPFVKDADESVVAIMYRVNTEDPPPLTAEGVPEDIALMIHTLMDKDPEKRPGSALEVAQWAQYLQTQRAIAVSPLHSDPDLQPELPPAALAAGAAALAVPTPPPPAPGTTPAPPTPFATGYDQTQGSAATYPTPAPTGYDQPASTAYTPAPQPAYDTAAATTYGQQAYAPATGAYTGSTGAYSGSTGAYDYSGGSGSGYSYPASSGSGWGGGKLVAIVAVIAVFLVALIIVIAAVAASSGDDSSSGTSGGNRSGPSESFGSASDSSGSSGSSGSSTPSATYPSAVRESFVNSCISGGGNLGYCNCVIDGIEELYSLDEFREWSNQLDGNDVEDFPEDVQAVIADCQ